MLRLEVSLVGGPVEDAFFPDVEDTEHDESEGNEHFPESEEARSGDMRQLAVDHGPGKHENGFHIEKDEKHRNHIEADGKPAAGIAFNGDAALVRFQLLFDVAMASDKPGHTHHAAGQGNHDYDLHQQREIVPDVVGIILHGGSRKNYGGVELPLPPF